MMASQGALAMLQWGHALSGMDITSDSQSAQITLTLQWGHALSGMDITAATRS